MKFELPTIAPARDRRVRRSRAALMLAAVTLVTERGTAAIPISDIAEAADVSRQLVYQQFGDRDALLLEAALDLAQRELMPRISDTSQPLPGREQMLAMAHYFADHRAFYRAMLTGSCGYALGKALTDLFIPLNRSAIQQIYGEQLDGNLVDDLAMFVTGGAAATFNTWIVEGEEPLDPEEFTDRSLRMITVLTGAMRQSATITHQKEPGQ